VKRREFLNIPAAALGGTLLYTLAREPLRLQAQNGNVRVPLKFFTAAEARTVTAASERIFPSDASGPGATEAGVVIYIDRQLAGPYGADKYRYSKGPWVDSTPEHGYQKRENPRDVYRQGIRDLRRLRNTVPRRSDAKAGIN
jgi:gluconate 2-dehydrogenase gamma chain